MILINMYVTLAPAIIAGVFNMIWCKSGLCKRLKKPMDGGKCFADGKRIFGDNKTWKGFFGMIAFGGIANVLWGFLCMALPSFEQFHFIYRNHTNTFLFNIWTGLLIGFAYALFELPNSFIKRRFDITPGKTSSGIKKAIFVFFDQADSIFGCVLVVCFFYPMNVWFYFAYVLVGALTHIILNMLLYFAKLRKNMF